MARINSLQLSRGACFALFCVGICVPVSWCAKKPSKGVTTANGAPVRKVYIQAGSPEMASSAATQLTQDTCLTTVPDASQADAVLDVGIALPGLDGGGFTPPDGSDSSPHPHTMGGGNNKPKPERSFSATCSDGKESRGCGSSSSYTAPRGGLAQPAAEWAGNVGSQLDVSLASPADSSQEIWAPDQRSKKSWSDQLRAAAGCPVCPDDHFNPRKYPTYRQWMQEKCPAVLAAP